MLSLADVIHRTTYKWSERLNLPQSNVAHSQLEYASHILADAIRRNPPKRDDTTLKMSKDLATNDISKQDSKLIVSQDAAEVTIGAKPLKEDGPPQSH